MVFGEQLRPCLGYLLLEPDIVKVDRRCIRTITTDAGDRRQLERLLDMLRAVDAMVIVEGVETKEELRILKDMGVPFGQGYLWGRPSRSLPRQPMMVGGRPWRSGAHGPWMEA